ncbi:delta-lactam-biosynthetic de-N-acetylase [Paenibacillus sp. MBLB4367]|uniref:delta-lactam-biosynthetic de-N-acetylase n=1 Tax=Paenibacillus sp. MBLB4367 TaxID=3384767 RepID=UPI00390802A4
MRQGVYVRLKRLRIVLLPVLVLSLALAFTVSAQDRGPYHFGFKKSRNGQLPSINEEGFKDIIDKHGAVFLGDTGSKALYLTFDNGYENGFSPRILDTLKEKKVPAAFFVTGQFVREQPELLKRMTAEGHIIGNHSWSHPDMTTISDAKIKEELDKVKEAALRVTGQPDMTFLRPPRGIFSERTLAVTKNMGYTNVFWSLAYMDWDVNAQKGAQYAYEKVMSQLHPGAVMLLHSISRDNAEALGRIIDGARKQGYEFYSLHQLKEIRPENEIPGAL